MVMITLTLLIVTSLFLVHFSVYFFDKNKASIRKAGVVVLSFVIFNNLVLFTGLSMPLVLSWVLYITFVSAMIWWLYRLPPISTLSVATFYLVSRMAVTYGISLVPLEILNA